MKALIIYHSVDFDGIVSGRIAYEHYVQSQGWAEAELEGTPNEMVTVGVNYGDPIPPGVLEGDYHTVVIVDFSWPMDQLRKIDQACHMVWIDHHKTAVESYQAVEPFRGTVILDSSQAACELTWEWANPNHRIPFGVWAVGAWDIRDWTRCPEEDATYFQFGLRHLNPKVESSSQEWERMKNEEDVLEILDMGKIISDWEKGQQARRATFCHEVVWEGLTWRVQVGPAIPVEVMWQHNPGNYAGLIGVNYIDGKWTVSLRRVPGSDLDLSAIAKKYGGGGHPGAAGFNKKEFPGVFFPG